MSETAKKQKKQTVFNHSTDNIWKNVPRGQTNGLLLWRTISCMKSDQIQLFRFHLCLFSSPWIFHMYQMWSHPSDLCLY